MKLILLLGAAIFTTSILFGQKVGINNTNPTERLDVTGNIKADTAKLSALVLNNGFMKVSGANKTAFIVTAVTGVNISGNQVILNYSSMSTTDILIVTHNFAGNYNNGLGTWWNGSAWTIFREDSLAMPNGEKFNVLVIKQ